MYKYYYHISDMIPVAQPQLALALALQVPVPSSKNPR